jgi:hypothetical protein
MGMLTTFYLYKPYFKGKTLGKGRFAAAAVLPIALWPARFFL